MEQLLLTAVGVFIGGVMSASFLFAAYKMSRTYDYADVSWGVIAAWGFPLAVVAFTVWMYVSP
jgi:hypothetical protein